MYFVYKTNNYQWNEVIYELSLDLQDIYFTSNYHSLYEKNGNGEAILFLYKENNNIAIYPFMKNEIKGYNLNGKFFDIESVYGYTGPLVNNSDEGFINRFENSFLKYCYDNNIVAEFVRFHPLIKNNNVFKKNIDVTYNRTTIYISLDKELKSIWDQEIDSKNRNMIRKAEKNGVMVVKSNDYNTFYEIYYKTMKKVKAQDYYFFKKEYFDSLKNDKNNIILNAIKDNKVIASAMFLGYGQYFHYHLSGSEEEYLKFAPNNLILWEAIKLAVSNGYKYFHLGGGLCADKEDSLFKFKSKFSKTYADYYIGKRIHNLQIYKYLINEWEKRTNTKTKMFLKYKNL